MNDAKKLCEQYKDEILSFLQQILSVKSLTGDEKEVANLVKAKMQELGYDEILTSKFGDIIGVMGNGNTKIIFDGHLDVVDVTDEDMWKFPPFSGTIDNGRIYSRGASDMKGAVAAIVYAGFFAKKLGLTKDKTIYISASVAEEDYDSIALANLIDEFSLKLDYAVICESSDQKIALGHRGRAMIVVDTFGISCHGSAPQNGKNAVYEMQKIIKRVEKLNEKLNLQKGEHGSVALTKIECETASLNAVPPKATIYLDRRLAMGEDEDVIAKEMNELVKGTNAKWYIFEANGKSYTNENISMHTFLKAWESPQTSTLAQALGKAYKTQMNKEPVYFKWEFATNGFATTARGVETIGFGPGEIKICHMRDEYCEVAQVINACGIYTNLIENL